MGFFPFPGPCDAAIPYVTTIVLTWSASSSSPPESGAGSGSASGTFTTGFAFTKTKCCKVKAGGGYVSGGTGTFTDHASSCTNTNTGTINAGITQQVDGSYYVSFSTSGLSEHCINTGLFDSSQGGPFNIAADDIIGSHTFTVTGGLFGGTYTFTWTITFS